MTSGTLVLSRLVLVVSLSSFIGLDAHSFLSLSLSLQAMVLRDQKSWSGRSAIERLFWTIDNSIELVARSTDWVARD